MLNTVYRERERESWVRGCRREGGGRRKGGREGESTYEKCLKGLFCDNL
jgi:hypothetical protein